jgi:NAD(P)-dependent dehydrogenase (short-subunit alcohol dehydrogenase family)
MKNFTKQYGFTVTEWETCLKVLNQLKENPLNNPDNKTFGALITKIHKKAKKELKNIEIEPRKEQIEPKRKKRRQIHKEFDMELIKSSTIVSNALSKTSLFTHDTTIKTLFSPLQSSKKCYCCHETYYKIHSFYHKLCPSCAMLNYAYRGVEVDLRGRNIILTGGRVKVGYAIALKFLRSEANLTITSRFPALSLEQFRKESDYKEWKDRLTIYGLDLRNLGAVEKFIAFYKSQHNSLDILVNNSAQTIRYTNKYYQPLVANEQRLLIELKEKPRLIANSTPLSSELKALEYFETLTQTNPLNRFGQPVDFREKNSWNSTLSEISIQELLEVNLINHISPYMLIKELTPLLKASPFKEKFIINVSSSEGQFSYANKTIHHPHTNMTKSALNMLTRTSAMEYSRDKIFMNSVDVGWISTGVVESKREKLFEKGSVPPLDSVDGMARILHPIYESLVNRQHIFGKLLKDFRVVAW